MDRRGFVTSGMAIGLAGLGGTGAGLGTLFGESPASRRRAWRTPSWASGKTLADGTVKLSSNENPLGLSPSAREAVAAAIPDANRYPGDFSPPLYDALAAHLGVARDSVILGAGSTEILRMAIHAYQGPGTPLVIAEPTFEDVTNYQRPLSYDLIAIPLTPERAHDLDRMREATERGDRPAVVYICNPNNPTGTLTPAATLDAWISEAPATTTFLVDEAYHEYADHPDYGSTLKWIDRRPNVIVVRTFSKIYGMAGMRLGYAVAHPTTVARLRAFVCRNNPNVLANAAALASLADDGLMARSVAVNDEAKAIAHTTLDELGLEYLPTQANFLMHRVNGDLTTYIGRMREAGVRVGRAFPPMLEWNRVSFGLPDEMDRWAAALKELRRQGWA
jgi:histidinol-phosphate aminotransferase